MTTSHHAPGRRPEPGSVAISPRPAGPRPAGTCSPATPSGGSAGPGRRSRRLRLPTGRLDEGPPRVVVLEPDTACRLCIGRHGRRARRPASRRGGLRRLRLAVQTGSIRVGRVRRAPSFVRRPIASQPICDDPDREQDQAFDEQRDLGRTRQVGQVEVGQGDHQPERRGVDERRGIAAERPLDEDRRQHHQGKIADPRLDDPPVLAVCRGRPDRLIACASPSTATRPAQNLLIAARRPAPGSASRSAMRASRRPIRAMPTAVANHHAAVAATSSSGSGPVEVGRPVSGEKFSG